jgi:hypothetical protein
MSVSFLKSSFVGVTVESLALSQIVDVMPSSSNPTYLVITTLDRNEYTVGATGATGSFSGNGHILNFSSQGGDVRGVGIVFTYQPSTGRYYNTTYGYLDLLVYKSSGSLDDVTNISLFGTNSLALANTYASNVYALIQADAAGYLGSSTVATEPNFTGLVPTQATPTSIAALAESFVGKAWNLTGCWPLASTIAAEGGPSLPVQTTVINVPGQANQEWMVVFNGPAGQTGNWQSMVRAGDIIVIATGGSGHITTCVAGSGSTAMLVDNVVYVDASGHVQNLANDGSSNDVTVAAPHPAAQEWSSVSASSVVIYRLDTPIVTATTPSGSLVGQVSLASLLNAVDPFGKPITAYQVYNTSTVDSLVVNGLVQAAHSATTALTVTALTSVSLLAGTTATTDRLMVRAFNGSYWGDWTALSVSLAALAPPVAATPIASPTWLGGKSFTLAVPTGTFTDPQHETLSYTAALSNGQALPSWLIFNSGSATFSGTAPLTAQTVSIGVTARNTSNLSVTATFNATIIGVPIVVVVPANQSWIEGQTISLGLAGTFSDPQNQRLTYSAPLTPNWLTFHAATVSFTGTAPSIAESLRIEVTATNTSGLSTSATFSVAVSPR